MTKATHEQLLAGEVYITSIINEPLVDFTVDFGESALTRARRRWRIANLYEREGDDAEGVARR